MLRISKLADYATVIMNYLARDMALSFSAKEISDQVHIGDATVRKILKLLANAGLVKSSRGSEGGYRLAQSADKITLAQVLTAIEGSPAMTECCSDLSVCTQESVCGIKGNWQLINQVIMKALNGISLMDMTRPLTEHPMIRSGIDVNG